MKLLLLRNSSEYSEVVDLVRALSGAFSVVEVTEIDAYNVLLDITQYPDEIQDDDLPDEYEKAPS
jgi:hypothetical protein